MYRHILAVFLIDVYIYNLTFETENYTKATFIVRFNVITGQWYCHVERPIPLQDQSKPRVY